MFYLRFSVVLKNNVYYTYLLVVYILRLTLFIFCISSIIWQLYAICHVNEKRKDTSIIWFFWCFPNVSYYIGRTILGFWCSPYIWLWHKKWFSKRGQAVNCSMCIRSWTFVKFWEVKKGGPKMFTWLQNKPNIWRVNELLT